MDTDWPIPIPTRVEDLHQMEAISNQSADSTLTRGHEGHIIQHDDQSSAHPGHTATSHRQDRLESVSAACMVRQSSVGAAHADHRGHDSLVDLLSFHGWQDGAEAENLS